MEGGARMKMGHALGIEGEVDRRYERTWGCRERSADGHRRSKARQRHRIFDVRLHLGERILKAHDRHWNRGVPASTFDLAPNLFVEYSCCRFAPVTEVGNLVSERVLGLVEYLS